MNALQTEVKSFAHLWIRSYAMHLRYVWISSHTANVYIVSAFFTLRLQNLKITRLSQNSDFMHRYLECKQITFPQGMLLTQDRQCSMECQWYFYCIYSNKNSWKENQIQKSTTSCKYFLCQPFNLRNNKHLAIVFLRASIL